MRESRNSFAILDSLRSQLDSVTPAQAGAHTSNTNMDPRCSLPPNAFIVGANGGCQTMDKELGACKLDSRLRGNDGERGVMKQPTYPKYKDSGVQWLGEVPEHWEVKRLKYSATINDEALPETTEPDFEFCYVVTVKITASVFPFPDLS